jgi:hypothetical protein
MTTQEPRRWVVMRDPESHRTTMFGGDVPYEQAEREVLRTAQIIDADTPREAAEAYRCSVLDMRKGMTLHVFPLAERLAAFHREYAYKGKGNDVWVDMPHSPVTVER